MQSNKKNQIKFKEKVVVVFKLKLNGKGGTKVVFFFFFIESHVKQRGGLKASG